MTAVAFDFRRPPKGGFEERVTRWLNDAGTVATKLWPRIMPLPTTIRVVSVESVPADSITGQTTEQDLGYRLSSGTNADEDCLLLVTRPLLLTLIAASVGESLKELPADRELTSIERPLAEHLLRQMIFAILQESWPTAGGLKLTVANQGMVQKVSPFAKTDIAICATLELSGAFGTAQMALLMPRSGLVQSLMHSMPAASLKPPSTQIESAVREFPIEMSVVLGSASVPLTRLANLAEGDLLILNQKVHEPLTARVANSDKFRVWVGAVGKQQAIRVDAVIKN